MHTGEAPQVVYHGIHGAQLASPWVNSTFGDLLCRFAVVNMCILLICGTPPQNEQKLQGPSTHSKERHVCHTGLGNTRRGKDGSHDQAVEVRNMVEYDDWARSVSLCNVLPALDSQPEEVETQANAQRCPKPASSDSRSADACTGDAKVPPVTRLQHGAQLLQQCCRETDMACCLLDPYAHDCATPLWQRCVDGVSPNKQSNHAPYQQYAW